PRYFCAFRAGDVDENAQVAQLVLKAVRFVIRKAEADKSVGVPAERGSIAGNHESVKESLRADEEADGGNHDGAELGEPSDEPGGRGIGLAFRAEEAGIANELCDGMATTSCKYLRCRSQLDSECARHRSGGHSANTFRRQRGLVPYRTLHVGEY